MGPVAFFSLCLLGCLIFNPSLEGSGVKATGCLNGWLRYRDHCFKFFPKLVTWSAAEVQCQHHQPGAHLASIVNEAERDVVVHYITMSGSNARVWIGLHDAPQDRTWVWTDGSLYRYHSWNNGEPNNCGPPAFTVHVPPSPGRSYLSLANCSHTPGQV
uniref:C-type lectin domain-containing protein n=1 Tax=Pelodiscus sinensis TaxID=13735 RepID=K7F8I3_PELSI